MTGLRNKLIWQEPIDIIFRDKFGILPIGATNRNSCPNFHMTEGDG